MKVLIFNIYDTNIIMSLFYNLFSLFNHDNLVFFFHYGGLGMFKCRSPPFLSEKQTDKKEMEETLWQKSITFMSADKR